MPIGKTPPPEYPVRTFPTPDKTDEVLIEWVTSELAHSQALQPGTAHPNSRDYPNHRLGKQDVNPRDPYWYIRYWVMDQPAAGELSVDLWNYAIQFAENSNLHPLIIRSYRIPKAGYLPLDKGDPDPSGTPRTYLVSEEAKQFPETSEFYAEYFNVIRVFETLPGPWIATTRLDPDGKVVTVNTRRQLTADAVDEEIIVGGVWTKKTHKGVDNQVCEEVVETRDLPGNVIPSVQYGADYLPAEIGKTLKDLTTITTGASESGGVIHTVEIEPVGDLVGNEVVTDKEWLDEKFFSVSIPEGIIPIELRAKMPTIVESHTVAGQATMPTLGPGEIEHSRRQKNAFLYDERVVRYEEVGVSVTGQETTTQYGGGILDVTVQLAFSPLTVDQGFLVVSSKVQQLANGIWIKTSRTNTDSSWPTLIGRDWNEEFQTYDAIETQVMDAEAPYVPPDPLPDFTVEDLRPLDKWRVRRVRRTVDPGNHIGPENALISYRYHPFQFPGTLDYNRLITFSHREGYRRAAALLAKHTIRTWWLVRDSDDPPTVGNADLGTFDIDVKEIISDTVNVPVYSSGSDLGAQSFTDVLHDDITNTLGAFYPATTPSFTEYYLGIGSGSTGTGSMYILSAPGTGYTLGGTITINGTGCTILSVGVSDSIMAINQPDAPPTGAIITGLSDGGAASVSGGGGSGAAFNELIVSYETTVPGSAWVGTQKVIAADIKYQNIPRLWKVITESVVMR
jgi:hypothetical protein